MVKTLRAFFLSFTILAFLLISTVGTTTVYADDGTGTETSETVVTTSEEEQPSEPQAGEESPAGDEGQPIEGVSEETPPPAGEEVQPVESSGTEEPAAEEPVETILEQVPDNTTVTVLNSEGETLPLVSQESADVIATSDPIWCPVAQSTPTPGLNGCTISFTSFTDLLNELQGNPVTYQGAGTIFVQQGDYNGGETSIILDTTDLSNISGSDLTVQGGWNTTNNTVDTTTSSNFNIPIIIGSSDNPWGGKLTINNIAIDGVSSQTGLTLYTTGAIVLEQVEVTNSQSGINLNAGEEISLIDVNASYNETYGARIRGDKVAIDTANFSNNGSGSDLNPTGSGLEVDSVNDVALIYVTANNNQLFGASIVSGNVVAVEHSVFSGNFAYAYTGQDDGYGLRVVTTSSIAVDDVTADNNNQYGAYLQGKNIAVENSSFSTNGSGVVTDPTGYGLQIVSTGEVQVLSVTANNNQFFGTDVKAEAEVTVLNSFFSGHQSVTNIGSPDAIFYGYGLKVDTPDDIFLDNVTGNFNNLWGANLIGNEVTVYNSRFNNNVSDTETFIDDTGLFVDAAGFVDIWRVEAKDNRLFGASIISGGDIVIAESFFTGNRGITCLNWGCTADVNLYHGIGLQVTTPGSIVVTDTDVSGNRLAGAELNGGVVTIANSTFNNSDMGNGLTINTGGNVSLTNVTASNNEGNGVEVNGVYCDQIVEVIGGTFSDNLMYGLSVLNAALVLDGTQVLLGNGSGNVPFNDTTTCVVVIQPAPQTTTITIPTDDSTVTGESNTTTTDNQTQAPPPPPVNTNLNFVSVTTTNNSGDPDPAPIITTNFKPENHMVQKTVKSHKDRGFKLWVWKYRHATFSSSFFLKLEELFRLFGGFSFSKMILPK